MALEWRTIYIPLSAGVNTGADPRALEAPALAVCRDAMFEEPGGAQTRYPFVTIGNNIFGGGTLSNVRRITANGDEILAFTKDTLYTWSVRDSAWVSKGTHLATKVSERLVFVNTQEQRLADRCEVGSCVITAWVETTASGGDLIYVGAQDKTTGAVILAPTHVDDGTRAGVTRPRLVALASKALLFFIDDLDALRVIDLAPATLAADVVSAGTVITASTVEYDAVANAAGTSALVAASVGGATYDVAVISSVAAITTSATKARTCDGPIAIADSPGATRLVVGRVVDNATATPDVRGDVLNDSTLADVTVNVLVGSIDASGNGPINQLAACYRSAQVGGQWSCHLFWTHDETTSVSGVGYQTRTNTLNDAGTAGTASTLFTQMSVASRAFSHDGRVYFWGAFGLETPFGSTNFRAQLQNSYFLYRDDGFLCAKAATTRSSGYSQEEGYLPGVQSLGSNVYGFCGIERRLISVTTKQRTYAARAPREILVEFDSNDGRRSARLGRTLYITGGEVVQYDGRGIVEVGWHVFPWRVSVADSGVAGNMGAGTYTYGATFRGDNAVGERDRSALVSTSDVAVAASRQVDFTVAGLLAATHREDSCIEIWRTQANPTVGAPMNLVTSNDPSVTSVGDNGYLPNIEGTYGEDDNYSDATLLTKEALDQVGDVLERLAPPPATIIAATQDRIFLAGIAGEPNQVWYSRLRDKDEVAAFHDSLVVEVPPTGGDITALAFLNETLVVFCEHAVWAVPGDGFSNVGDADGSRNYGPARLLSSDVGAVNAEAVALSPRGLEFHSQKGKMLLGQDWSVQYVGSPVADFDADTHVAVHVLEKKHEVRWLTTSRMLVFNYKVNQWSEWTVSNGVSATMWNGTHHYASSTAVLAYQTAYGTNVTYAMDLETAWIPVGPGGKLGRGKVLWIQVLGEFVSAHDLRLRVGRDYLSDSSGATLFHSKYWPATPTTVGGRLQVQHAPSIRLMEAVKLRITPYASGSTTNPPTGGALKVTGFALHVGLEPGIWRSLASAQRQ